MRINTYMFRDSFEDSGWRFDPVHLKLINLLIGITGAGKTRLLNTISNLAQFVVNDVDRKSGFWRLDFEEDRAHYQYELFVPRTATGVAHIAREHVYRFSPQGDKTVLISRDENGFSFKGTKLPKLPIGSTALNLLKEEEDIAPIYGAFRKIRRRNFDGGDMERLCAHGRFVIDGISHPFSEIDKTALQEALRNPEMFLNAKLYLMSQVSPREYKAIENAYKEIFPNVIDVKFIDLRDSIPAISPAERNIPAPTFSVIEKHVTEPIPLSELSAGMKKVLLIITDIMTMEPASVYLIDEYENSLGINAINFLPTFLADYGDDHQFFITSHHPYLINLMPIRNWLVFSRDGSKVTIRSGEQLQDIYGRSKQEHFHQLINDPIYLGTSV